MRLLFPALLVVLFLLSSCGFKQRELGNVYRAPLPEDVKGFDPAQSDDLYSYIALKQIYETLLKYHPLKRPYTLAPLLTEALPEISKDRLTYTFHLKNDVFFQDDPCFKGVRRHLVAEDVVFSLKRLADIKVKSTGWWLFDGRIKGLDEFRKKSASSSKTDYQLPVEGLFAPDSFTVVLKLTSPCPQFSYFFAMSFTAVVPKEAVEFYGEEFLNHPVGTGPFKLIEWRRRLKLKYARNPFYRQEYYPCEGESEDRRAGYLEDCGKPLPLIDTLVLGIFLESEPMWLNFLRQGLDASGIPKDNYNRTVNPDMTLNPDFVKQGITLSKNPMLDLTYTSFNMEDSLLGRNVHLRRAMCYAWNNAKTIELLYNGRAIPAQTPIPPGLLGYDSTYVNPYQKYDTALAKKELVLAGYPQGKGLPEFHSLDLDNTVSRQWSEKFVKEMKDVGIRIKVDAVTWPEFLKRLKTKSYQIAGSAWAADYPDPENFLQLLYGPNEAPGTNNANYKNPAYDSLYREMLLAPDDTARVVIIRRMRDIAVADCPWILGTHRLSMGLRYQWVKNAKYNDIAPGEYKYVRVDIEARNRAIRERP